MLVRARKPAGLAVIAGLAVLAAGCASMNPTSMNTAWVAPPFARTPGAVGPPSSAPPAAGGGQYGTSTGNSAVGGGQPGSGPGTQPSSTPSPVGTTPSGPGTGPNSPPGGNVRGVLFGGDLKLAAEEPQLGRRLAIVRIYDLIGQHFPNRYEAQLMSQGTTVLISLDTYPGHGPSYASIAAGRDDGVIRTFLDSVEQAAVTYHLSAIYVTFQHEADNISKRRGLGSPAQFVQAWDHIHALAASAHLDWNQGGRIHWVMILMHSAYISGKAASFWPGTGEADAVGADGYNTGGCRQARRTGGGFTNGRTPPVSPASLFGKAVSFAAARHVPLFIAEWGSVPYTSPSVRAGFIQQMQSFVQSNPQIGATLYWDSQVPPCNYIVNNSSSSLAALASMGREAYMQGSAAG